MTPKAQAPKPKMNKKDYIKPKSFFTAKETINKIKDNLWNGRKYLQTILIRGLYQKYTKNSHNSIAKKKANNPIEKIVKRPGGLGLFPKKIYKWWTGMKICSTLLIIAVVQSPSCVQLCNPMDYSMSAFLVLHCLLAFAQIHVC